MSAQRLLALFITIALGYVAGKIRTSSQLGIDTNNGIKSIFFYVVYLRRWISRRSVRAGDREMVVAFLGCNYPIYGVPVGNGKSSTAAIIGIRHA
jgi:hypothetical protein